MFRSQRRPIVISQAEHARLSAAFAAAYGNDAFESPAIARERFVAGVAAHDRGYGALDADAIGEVSDARWSEITRRGFDAEDDDPLVDHLVRMHLVRLARSRPALQAELRAMLPASLVRSGLDADVAAAADRVMDLCDRLSFDLCVEEAVTGAVAVCPRRDSPDTVEVRYELDGRGTARLDPWPLGVPRLEATMTGYAADGYPRSRAPLSVDVAFVPVDH